MNLSEQLKQITEAITRGKGQFALGPDEHGRCMLAVGAPSTVKVHGGRLIMIGLSREQCAELRDLCDQLLLGAPPA